MPVNFRQASKEKKQHSWAGKYGNIRGVDHFTGICHYMSMEVLSLKLHIPQIHKEFNEEMELFKDDTVKFTKQQIEKFVGF
jgi:hypothetical protein